MLLGDDDHTEPKTRRNARKRRGVIQPDLTKWDPNATQAELVALRRLNDMAADELIDQIWNFCDRIDFARARSKRRRKSLVSSDLRLAMGRAIEGLVLRGRWG
jgi:hypothetical protein